MKIIHSFFTMETGGAQVLAVDMLNHLCRSQEVGLVILNNQWSRSLLEKLDEKVKVYHIGRKEGSRNPFPLLKFNYLLSKLKPDIIHCHEPNMARLIKVKSARLVYTIHDVGIPVDYYDRYDSLVAISDAVYEDVAARYTGTVKTVYNGIDSALFRKRTGYRVSGEPLRLVQISRLVHEKKGQDVLLQALKEIKSTYGYANFRVDFAGNGPSLGYLEGLAASLGLSDHVRFVGEKDRNWLFANLAGYHLLVQPSRYEGFGLTILEGFAAGLPVLVSDVEGPAEIVSRSPRGFTFTKGDVQSCAAALHKIITLYETGAVEQLMHRTTSLTETEYSIQSCAEGYLNEYKAQLHKG